MKRMLDPAKTLIYGLVLFMLLILSASPVSGGSATAPTDSGR